MDNDSFKVHQLVSVRTVDEAAAKELLRAAMNNVQLATDSFLSRPSAFEWTVAEGKSDRKTVALTSPEENRSVAERAECKLKKSQGQKGTKAVRPTCVAGQEHRSTGIGTSAVSKISSKGSKQRRSRNRNKAKRRSPKFVETNVEQTPEEAKAHESR